VIKLVDNLKIADYKTNLGLMIKTVPVVAVPYYWTPEWHEFYMRSEADEIQTFTWGFRTEIIGRFFRHEWTLKIHSPMFPGEMFTGEFSGANYNIEDLPYTETFRVTPKEGDPEDFADLEITLVSETSKIVQVQYKLTLKPNWHWDGYSIPSILVPIWLPLQVEYWGKLACIPDFSYEARGTLSLPHYPDTYPNTPPEDQPDNGWSYDIEDSYKFRGWLGHTQTIQRDTPIKIGLSRVSYDLNGCFNSVIHSYEVKEDGDYLIIGE
ncbi:unnamed protein product, partial [marine sediment metagenome]